MIALLVTYSLTINCCLADLIDVILADEDAFSKVVDCLQMLKLVLSKSFVTAERQLTARQQFENSIVSVGQQIGFVWSKL